MFKKHAFLLGFFDVRSISPFICKGFLNAKLFLFFFHFFLRPLKNALKKTEKLMHKSKLLFRVDALPACDFGSHLVLLIRAVKVV